MATDNVEFYERMQKLQAIQQQRETQRMSLEQQFNTYLKSDKRLNQVRASKLQSYWTKICENERRSRARNEQLWREYERVEAHVSALSARTDRLRLLKDQYEQQMEVMFPWWQEQVELRRRHLLLQQQKEQQQLAQQLQQLQQASGQEHQWQQQLQQQQRHYQIQHQLPTQQQQQQRGRSVPQQQLGHMTVSGQQQQQQHLHPPLQQPPSLQPMDLNGDYHHLRRTAPLVPNHHVQPGTPSTGTSEDPRYASIGFGAQPLSSLMLEPSTVGSGQPANTPGAGEFESYEVPSMFGVSQPVLQNGLSVGQDQVSGVTSVGVTGRGTSLQAPPPNTDPKLQTESQGFKSGPLTMQPCGSSVYTDVAHVKAEPEARAMANSSEVPGMHTASAGVSGGETSVEQRRDSQPRQPSAGALGFVGVHGKQAPQAAVATGDNDDDDDTAVTPLDEEDLYLEPSAAKPGSKRIQPKSSEVLRPAERAGSAVSAKAISTARTDPFTSEEDDDNDDGEDEDEDKDDSTEKEALREALQRQVKLGDAASARRQPDEMRSRREPQQPDNLQKGDTTAGKPPLRAQLQESDAPDDEVSRDESGDSEIGSDVSLPLSDTDQPAGPAGNGRRPVGTDQAASKSAQDVRAHRPVAVETVTEQGFWRLVSAVELEIEESDNIEKIYNLPECTVAIKGEIVRAASSRGSLDRLDPNAISMVVLEQLQQIARTMPGACLLSDQLLDTKHPVTEITIRSFLYSSALAFWDKLLQHLLLLIRKGVMDAEEVASLFAPRLIGEDSVMATKAFDVLSSILQNLHEREEEEESQLDDTYSTLPSASATPSHLDTPRQSRDRHQAPPGVPPLDLADTADRPTPDLETDRASHDSFFDEPPVPLTETKAYQQLMQRSQGHPAADQDGYQGNGDVEEGVEGLSSEDEDDEIERATRLTPETPPSSRNKKRRNVLSSFGGSGSLGISYGENDREDKDTRGEAVSDGGAARRSEVSDIVSSPSPSPSPKGSGYVPSVMEQSLKSTSRSEPVQRSAAFWGEESDMEESEMSVPMGTGTLKSDDFKDDFDFYD